MALMDVWVNPLQILEIDEPWAPDLRGNITPEVFLSFLSTPTTSSSPDVLAARYREISIERERLFAAPLDDRIMRHIVWPLRHAKAAYTVGNHLATIAISGVVAEKMALLLWDVFGSASLENEAKVRKELGRGTFENADQARRVAALRAANLIAADERHAYSAIRTARREHMHIWSGASDSDMALSAVQMFDNAVFIVVRGFGFGVVDGVLQLKQGIIDYITRKAPTL